MMKYIGEMERARRYVRVMERANGTWACRRGRDDIDAHPSMDAAIECAVGFACEVAPSAVFVHRLDGSVEPVALLDS